jgi:hypothetical protein
MKVWQYCLECGQVYPTARSLRKAYRQQFWSATGLSTYHPRMPLVRRLWRVVTIRAKRIYFCQECTHDFLFNPQSWTTEQIAEQGEMR